MVDPAVDCVRGDSRCAGALIREFHATMMRGSTPVAHWIEHRLVEQLPPVGVIEAPPTRETSGAGRYNQRRTRAQ
jgi:hypothetical protein